MTFEPSNLLSRLRSQVPQPPSSPVYNPISEKVIEECSPTPTLSVSNFDSSWRSNVTPTKSTRSAPTKEEYVFPSSEHSTTKREQIPVKIVSTPTQPEVNRNYIHVQTSTKPKSSHNSRSRSSASSHVALDLTQFSSFSRTHEGLHTTTVSQTVKSRPKRAYSNRIVLPDNLPDNYVINIDLDYPLMDGPSISSSRHSRIVDLTTFAVEKF
ncbi:hypothetical protein RCL1_006287 [Eukaryota sp. TZLM3-RCL]